MKERNEIIEKISELFPDIIETTFEISDDVTGINDLIQDELYSVWIKEIASDSTLTLEEKANEWERLAKAYHEDRKSSESIIINERKERTENMIKIFQKVIFPTMIVFAALGGANELSKYHRIQNTK